MINWYDSWYEYAFANLILKACIGALMIPSLIYCLPYVNRLVIHDNDIFERHEAKIKRLEIRGKIQSNST